MSLIRRLTWMAWLTVPVLALSLWAWASGRSFPWLLVVFGVSVAVSVVGAPPGRRWSGVRGLYLREPTDRDGSGRRE